MTCCRTGRCLNCVCVCVPSTFHSDLETVLIPLKLPIAPNDMPVQPLIVPNITPSNRPTASQNLLHTPLPRPGDAILHSLNLSPLQTLQTPCLLGGNTTVWPFSRSPMEMLESLCFQFSSYSHARLFVNQNKKIIPFNELLREGRTLHYQCLVGAWSFSNAIIIIMYGYSKEGTVDQGSTQVKSNT